MTPIEYRVEVLIPAEYVLGENVGKKLNALAAEGWRVLGSPVAVSVENIDRLVYTLTREQSTGDGWVLSL